ncbi:MAG TPA: tyrosine-protein phosphatase [Planktothrix sp.]|jgi:protein tyrosine/serine phosphatase
MDDNASQSPPDFEPTTLSPPVDASVPIPNFRRVTPFLFRGGQPGEEGFKALAELGVRTVVNLRWRPRHVAVEREQVEATGMAYVSFRLAYWVLPNEKVINDFLAIVDDSARRPIFVHCLHGADRTGLLVAIFRISRQGWSVEDAYKDMKGCGYHRFRVRNFKWNLFYFARKYKERQAKEGSRDHF